MSKYVTKLLCVLLAVLLVASAMFCLAETERETIISGYAPLNAIKHVVYTETWEYPIIDGQRGSGRPVDSGSYTEGHSFTDGRCTECGYSPYDPVAPTEAPTVKPIIAPFDPDDDDDDDDGGDDNTTTEQTPAGEAPVIPEATYTTASGVDVSTGTPAKEALQEILSEIPNTTNVRIDGVDAEVAEQLMTALNSSVTQEELLEILKSFPVQTVDGIDCYVVTFVYTDANGSTTESYAFSTFDGSLVKVF